VIALVIAGLFDLLLLPLFLEALAAPGGQIQLRLWFFIALFATTFLALYLGYGYRISIQSDRQSPHNRSLVVRSVGHSVATYIPLETIEEIHPMKYQDLPDEVYAIPQYGYRGEGLLLYYRLSGRHGDGSGKQRYLWFPACQQEQLKQWLKIPEEKR
jgi:hypothetical protein